jgi:hypothetical protein
MKKHVITWHGKKYYYLGSDADGLKHYLEAGSFDCGWYWGFGYIEAFTNNTAPQLSRDICVHTHFDSCLLNGGGFVDRFRELFTDTPLSTNEIWQLLELMQSFYTARKYSDMLHTGGAHITSNPAGDTIKSDTEYKRINECVIPAIMAEVYKLLDPTAEE